MWVRLFYFSCFISFAGLLLALQQPNTIAATETTKRQEAPSEYAQLKNPLTSTPELLASATTMYNILCHSCHGTNGKADTPAALASNPKPANLAAKGYVASMSDGYLYWRIAEGGAMAPFNSTMPPYKLVAQKEDMWKLVLLIRTFKE